MRPAVLPLIDLSRGLRDLLDQRRHDLEKAKAGKSFEPMIGPSTRFRGSSSRPELPRLRWPFAAGGVPSPADGRLESPISVGFVQVEVVGRELRGRLERMEWVHAADPMVAAFPAPFNPYRGRPWSIFSGVRLAHVAYLYHDVLRRGSVRRSEPEIELDHGHLHFFRQRPYS